MCSYFVTEVPTWEVWSTDVCATEPPTSTDWVNVLLSRGFEGERHIIFRRRAIVVGKWLLHKSCQCSTTQKVDIWDGGWFAIEWRWPELKWPTRPYLSWNNVEAAVWSGTLTQGPAIKCKWIFGEKGSHPKLILCRVCLQLKHLMKGFEIL